MGKEKRGRQRGEGAFPSFFGVSVVFCEGSMTEKRVPVARCLVLHSHGEASACPRSVASQQDDGPRWRVGGREARGREKSTYRRQGPLGSMCLCRYRLSFGRVLFLAIIGVQGHVFPTFPLCSYISLFGFLVWYTGNFNRGETGEKGEMPPTSNGLSVWDGETARTGSLKRRCFCGWSANHRRIMMIFFAHLILISPKTGRRTELLPRTASEGIKKSVFHEPPFPFRLGKF